MDVTVWLKEASNVSVSFKQNGRVIEIQQGEDLVVMGIDELVKLAQITMEGIPGVSKTPELQALEGLEAALGQVQKA